MSPRLVDPESITAESFAIIRREAALGHLPEPLHPVAQRMIHASGMVDLAADIAGDARFPEAAEAALKAGAPVLCDCAMVKAGIVSRHLAGNPVLVTLADPRVLEIAARLGTTRSAAAVELWREHLGGAVVVIGNAPTALFRLIELLEEGAPRPAAIVATPVGFVGAAESKARLAESGFGIPHVTVHGRRGGSAIASAALNAVILGMAGK